MQIYTSKYVLPITSSPIENGAIVVMNDKIVDVGRYNVMSAEYPDAPITDFGNAAIMPGLVNVHSHLELTIFRNSLEIGAFQGWIVELIRRKSQLTPDELLGSARLGCTESIKAGITTTADTADSPATLTALIESGMRGRVYQEFFGPDVSLAAGSMDGLKAKLDSHRNTISKAYNGADKRLSIGISPHAPYSVSSELYKQAAKYALKENLDVAIHAAESEDEDSLLFINQGAFADSLKRRGIQFNSPGVSTVTYLESLGVLDTSPLLIHCVKTDVDDLILLKKHKARIAHCPKSNSKFGHGVAPFQRMMDCKINVGLGTDSAASNNNLDLIEESRFCSLIQRANNVSPNSCSAEEMISLITLGGARALNLDHQIGSLEPGKQADFIAIDLSSVHSTPVNDPVTAIIFSCSGRDVIFTCVAGKILFKVSSI